MIDTVTKGTNFLSLVTKLFSLVPKSWLFYSVKEKPIEPLRYFSEKFVYKQWSQYLYTIRRISEMKTITPVDISVLIDPLILSNERVSSSVILSYCIRWIQ